MSWFDNVTDYSNATANVQCEDPQADIFWTCVTICSFVFGFPGAAAILLDMFEKGRKGMPFSPNVVFMLNLTVMDILFLILRQSEWFYDFYEHNLVAVAFNSFLYSFNVCGRPLFITCICLDCYLAVVHPLTYRERKSLTPRILMAVGVWTATSAYGFYFAMLQKGDSEPIPILFYILTLPVIGFCDVSILWTLMRSSPARGNIHPSKKKALQITIHNLIIGLFSYLPSIIGWFLSEITTCLDLTPLLSCAVFGNTLSINLHLNNMGKLDWLKFWKQKWTTFLTFLFSLSDIFPAV